MPRQPKPKVDEPVVNQEFTVESTVSRWNSLLSQKYDGCDHIIAMQTAMGNNPYIQNQRLKQLKSQPIFHNRETIEDALKSPQSSERPLREASWSLGSTSFPMYKMMKMYADILTYNYTITPKYVSREEMNTPRFKSDSKLLHMWADKLDPKSTFRRITSECMREGKKAYYLRQEFNANTGKENVDYVMLQELPSDWTKITAKSEASYFVSSFNFTYFWTPGTSVYQFPPVFEEYYKELMGCSERTPDAAGYKINIDKAPTTAMIEYAGGNWYFWKELPSDECWTFSVDETNVWQLPPFMGLFLTAQDLQSYAYLQQQLTSIPLYGMVLAEIPFHEGNNSRAGQFTDDMRLKPDTVALFTDWFNAKAPMGTDIYAAPFQNMKYTQFQEVPNGNTIYANALQQYIATAGLTGLLSTSEKPTVAMVKASQLIESRFSDILYGQFKKFVDITIERKLKLKYKWIFNIFGNIFTDKEDKADLQKAVAMGQTSLLPKLLAYYGCDIEDALCSSDWMDSIGIYDKMKVVATAFQGGGLEKTNGRPSADISNVESDNTAASIDSGQNTADAK